MSLLFYESFGTRKIIVNVIRMIILLHRSHKRTKKKIILFQNDSRMRRGGDTVARIKSRQSSRSVWVCSNRSERFFPMIYYIGSGNHRCDVPAMMIYILYGPTGIGLLRPRR